MLKHTNCILSLQKETIIMPKLPNTDIYAITDSMQSLGRSNVEVVEQMLLADIKIIQYREKNKSSGEMLKECLQIRELTLAAGCFFIVNDHVDIAMLCKADGVHVGQDDLPLVAVRSLLGRDCIVGVSVHSVAEAGRAIADGADYLGVGAVFPTLTKADAKHTGLELTRELSKTSPVPVVSIGGINEQNIGAVASCGVSYFAIVSAITKAQDIPAKVALLRRELALA